MTNIQRAAHGHSYVSILLLWLKHLHHVITIHYLHLAHITFGSSKGPTKAVPWENSSQGTTAGS